ncbi:hypothetical protein ACFX1Q_030259 [Malus domestica]
MASEAARGSSSSREEVLKILLLASTSLRQSLAIAPITVSASTKDQAGSKLTFTRPRRHECCNTVTTAIADFDINLCKSGGGVAGFCMGGALSIASSVLLPDVDAVALRFMECRHQSLLKLRLLFGLILESLIVSLAFQIFCCVKVSPIRKDWFQTNMHYILQNLKVRVRLLFGIDSSWKEVAMKLTIKSEDEAVSDAIHEIVANG